MEGELLKMFSGAIWPCIYTVIYSHSCVSMPQLENLKETEMLNIFLLSLPPSS